MVEAFKCGTCGAFPCGSLGKFATVIFNAVFGEAIVLKTAG